MEANDLIIENYNLEDLLNLFSLPVLFNEADLKRAKQMVLKTHPDKSSLPKEYFLFFSKAYRIVHQIYTFRNPSIKKTYTQRPDYGGNSSSASEPYIRIDGNVAKLPSYTDVMESEGYLTSKYDIDTSETNRRLKQRLDELVIEKNGGIKTDGRGFNAWFNEQFIKHKQTDEYEEGYGEWLKNSDPRDDGFEDIPESSDWNTKLTAINRRKQQLKQQYALVEHREVQTFNSGGGGYDLVRNKPEDYSSGIFSQLKYEDVRKAHTETVIPVTEEDYLSRQSFKTVNDYQQFRDRELRDSRNNTLDAHALYDMQKRQSQEEDVRRAFLLAKQDEAAREIHHRFHSSLFRLQ